MKLSIRCLCAKVDMTRQNYYKARKRREAAVIDEALVVELVKAERAVQPRLGGRKLYYLLKRPLLETGLKMGRDRFFRVLRGKKMLVPPLPKSPRTTNSRHTLPVFTNLIKDVIPTGPNQVWVSDITYVRTTEGFVYVSLITDKYSRKIVGYHVGDTLETEGSSKALAMALEHKPFEAKPVHHSDRGCQYCSHSYVKTLQENGLRISMTEEDHCAENAMAERVNGILKQEYYLGGTFTKRTFAQQAVKEAVWLYNTRRPHNMLKYQTPEMVHNQAA